MNDEKLHMVLSQLRSGSTLNNLCTEEETHFFKIRFHVPEITRPFGIEAEFYSEMSRENVCEHLSRRTGLIVECEGYSGNSNPANWKMVPDGSISGDLDDENNDMELVSPKLSNTRVKEVHGLYRYIYGWKSGGEFVLQVNPSCGLHVHVSVEHNSAIEKQRIFETFKILEPHLMKIIPDHRLQSSYCKSIQSISSYTALKTASKYHSMRISFVGGNRSLQDRRERTFEYRLHSSTRNPNVILNWVRILDAIHLYGEQLQSSPARSLSFYDVVESPILWNYFNSRKNWLMNNGVFNERKRKVVNTKKESSSSAIQRERQRTQQALDTRSRNVVTGHISPNSAPQRRNWYRMS